MREVRRDDVEALVVGGVAIHRVLWAARVLGECHGLGAGGARVLQRGDDGDALQALGGRRLRQAGEIHKRRLRNTHRAATSGQRERAVHVVRRWLRTKMSTSSVMARVFAPTDALIHLPTRTCSLSRLGRGQAGPTVWMGVGRTGRG